MDLQPTEEQDSLVEMISAFAVDRFPIDIIRGFSGARGFDRDRWRELAMLGTFGIAVPEGEGGVGLGFIDAVLVHQALGSKLVPGPLVAATLAAGIIDGVLEGDNIPCILDASIDGTIAIENFRDADTLLIVRDEGIAAIATEQVSGMEVEHPTDPTTPITILSELPIGSPILGAQAARDWRLRGSLLASAQLMGNSYGSTNLAVDYAKEREQFGRPIGSFQGLKHLLADSWIRSEMAKSSVWSAGVMVDEPEVGSVERAVHGARLTSARAATENAKTCIQVHGGMGFTWEVDAHLYLKRAWVLETQFGSVDDAAESVASAYSESL